MVEMQITDSDLGRVVRFQRQRWSDLLQRHFMDTDLIIIIDPEREQDMREDFAIYRALDEKSQRDFLKQVGMERYTGRLLQEQHRLCADTPQISLFD